MSKLQALKEAKTLGELAYLLGYTPSKLSYIVYKIPEAEKYTTFDIAKKSGGLRTILSPCRQLNRLQKKVCELLNDCQYEIDQTKNYRVISHGFKKNHSIITNAINHKRRRYVFNIDLKDFFPSINFGRVRGYFISNKDFRLNESIATILAQIIIYKNQLPQGSPCSPIVSNFIGAILDMRLSSLAKENKCIYTRYADDITFSTNTKVFPQVIAVQDNSKVWTAGKSLSSIIDRTGFTINERKTNMQYKDSRQIVTGLVVNKKVNYKREYYKKVRAMCHNLFTTNAFYIESQLDSDFTSKYFMKLNGYLNYLFQIQKANKKPNKRGKVDDKVVESNLSKLYHQFLFYFNFVINDIPIIITEGETDSIYLKTALRRLAPDFSEFLHREKNKLVWMLKFLKVNNPSIKKILLGGNGSGALKNTIENFKSHKFKNICRKNPVIILLDNDSGAKDIVKIDIVKNGYKLEEGIIHCTENLYILFLPKVKIDNKDGCIEDFFDESVLLRRIGQKTFNKVNENCKENEYGKAAFATQIIVKQQASIDFTKFKEIFDDISKIINHYATIVEPPISTTS